MKVFKPCYKFRGKSISNEYGVDNKLGGEYIYGDLTVYDNSFTIRFRENNVMFSQDEYEVEVDPNTVAQLIGYDKNFNEVYEDDYLIDISKFDRPCVPAIEVLKMYSFCDIFDRYVLRKE